MEEYESDENNFSDVNDSLYREEVPPNMNRLRILCFCDMVLGVNELPPML